MNNFWDHHGIFFLIFIALFPRLTLLFSSVPFGGFFWWLGFIFAPRILVAVLATMNYLQTNPILVLISWIVAFWGESTEKYTLKNRVRVVHIGGIRRPHPNGSPPMKDVTPVDADFKRLE